MINPTGNAVASSSAKQRILDMFASKVGLTGQERNTARQRFPSASASLSRASPAATSHFLFLVLVPTLCLGTPAWTLCVANDASTQSVGPGFPRSAWEPVIILLPPLPLVRYHVLIPASCVRRPALADCPPG